MKHLALIPFIALVQFSYSQNLVSKIPLEIGERIELRSNILNENRVLNIYLPASYNVDSSTNYPVIYLLDGSMDEDFLHIAGLVQFGSFSWINMLPESIVVGIANVDRRRDYTFPTTVAEDLIDNPTSGKSEIFVSYLEKEVIPLVASSYRTSDHSTLIGQSLGGLLTTEIMLKKPQLFKDYIIVSPSLWWNNESLLLHKMPILQQEQKVFIAVGKEGDVMENDANQLYKLLNLVNSKGNIGFRYFKEHDHGDILHQAVYRAFEWLNQ